MPRRRRPGLLNSWLLGALASVALAASAAAQVHPGRPVAPPLSRVSAPPLPVATMRAYPIASPRDPLRSRYVGKVAPGTRVPLSRLPHPPLRTRFDTLTPQRTKHGAHVRPMAATGATIDVTAGANCGSSGALYPVDCTIAWQSMENENLPQWHSGDTFQDYVLEPDAVAAVACSVALCGTSGTYTGNTGSAESTELTASGTYMLGTYDATARVWVSAVYVTAGQAFTIAVYEDPFHTEESYQFDVSSSPAAYVFMQNLAPSDDYVVYVTSTAVNAYCVFIAPGPASPSPGPPSPMPTGSPNALLCNPSASAGIQAPGGQLAITWPLSASLQAGTYSIVVYDVTQQQAMGEVQVSLTGSGGKAILLYPNKTDANASPAAPATPPNTEFAWDGTSDQSTGGVVGSISNLPAGSYTWTVSDPGGMVVARATPAALPTTGTGTASFTFSGMSPAISEPAQYPASVWTMQVYQPSKQAVISSQSFRMLGYSSETEFVSSTNALSNVLNIPCYNNNCYYQPPGSYGSVQSGLTVENASGTAFPNAGDNFNEILYSTGNTMTTAFNSPPPDTGQSGVFVTLNAGATPAPPSACYPTACTLTETDTNGQTWNITDLCSNDTVTVGAGDTAGECVLSFVPSGGVGSGVTLTPGASITIPAANMTWYANSSNSAWGCYTTTCSTATVEFPTHGITWSGTSSSTPAYVPALIGRDISTPPPGSTASASIVGSLTCDATCSGASTQRSTPAPPVPGTHYYYLNFDQADYQQSSPFQASTSREDVIKFTINSSSCCGEYAIGLPPYFSTSNVKFDADQNPNTGWAKTTCPNNFGPQYFCMNNGSLNSPVVLDLDVPMPVSSFTAQEFSVQGLANNGANEWETISPTGSSCAAIAGNGACTTFDGLGIAAWSLNENLMSALFEPATVGAQPTANPSPVPLTMVVTNTSTAADPNPDPIDLVVIEQISSKNWTVSGTPSLSGSGSVTDWTNLSSTGYNPTGNVLEYWFGVCSGQYTNRATATYGSPPQSPPNPANPSAPAASSAQRVPVCSTAQEEQSLAPGESLTINMSLAGMGGITGAQTFYMYAHGANGGGWSYPKPMTVTFSNESTEAGFASVNGTSVGTNNVPTIGSSPNTYVYALTNTSKSQHVSTVAVTLPAWDINGAPATDGTNYWEVTGTPTLSGNGDTGCTVAPFGSNPASNSIEPTPGSANGQILITGCTGFAPNDTLDVTFTSSNPLVESDTYLFPSTVDGITTTATWLGDQQVQVQYSIGLSLTVDPSNPGAGGSTPSVSCSQCSFSGETIDFGQINAGASVTGTNVAKASVIYTGASSGHTWSLSISTSGNPTCSNIASPPFTCAGGSPLSELLVELDSANSSNSSSSRTKCGSVGSITYSNNTSFVALTSSGVSLATGPETECTEPYELINSFEIQVGGEGVNGHIQTITYTLVAN